MGLVECPPSSWLVRLAARKQARTRRLGSRFVRSRRRRGWSHQFARGRVQGRASLHRDRSRSLGQRPSSERPGWSSGRRPSGQWNLRSASEIGCSLMLASWRSIRPSASNCVQTSTDHRAHDPIYDSGTHRWPCDLSQTRHGCAIDCQACRRAQSAEARLFQASSARGAFCAAVASSNGGRGCRLIVASFWFFGNGFDFCVLMWSVSR